MLQRPYVWLEAVSRYRGHTSGGPNFAWDLCVRRLNAEQVRSLDLGSWTVAGIGAEPVRVTSMDRFAEHFAAAGFCREAFHPSYGLAEGTLFVAGGKRTAPPVTLSVATATAERGEVATATVGDEVGATRTLVGCGKAWLDQQVAIVDPEAGATLLDGHVGEIWVAGPSIAQGYWNRPDESATVFRAELGGSPGRTFLRTGDLGFVRDEELFVTGRIKDLLIIRGQNHYPQNLEETVQSVDPAFRIDGGAAFQVERDDGARLVVIQEIDRRRATLDPAALARRVRSVIAERHGIEIDEIVFVRNGTLPKTTSGKVQRYACKAAHEAGRLAHWRSDDTPRRGTPHP